MKFREVDMSNDFDFSVYPNCEIHRRTGGHTCFTNNRSQQ